MEWKRKIKDRLTPARDIGLYNAYGEEGWNDELLVGDRVSEPEEQVKSLLRDAEVEVKGGRGAGEEQLRREEVQRPMPRWTEADEKGDRKSLNRALTRTLYLMVKRERRVKGESEWRFPEAELTGKESLHTVRRGVHELEDWGLG